MDSFYPRYGEVELVLVEDNNDFFDPLETNFDCDDENEDVKLQLNDTVYEDNQFHLNADETVNSISTEESATQHDGIKYEVFNESSESPENANDRIKVKSLSFDISYEDSYDEDDAPDNAFDTVAEEATETRELKPKLEKSNEPKDSIAVIDLGKPGCDSTNTNVNELENNNGSRQAIKVDKSKIESLPEKSTKRKQTRRKAKSQDDAVKVEASAAASKCDIKNKQSTKKKSRRKVIKEDDESESKETRHYSKRNEIPKQVVHNEAYDKKLLFCKICSIQFEKSPMFTDHMRSQHSVDKPFECYICSKPYRIRSLLAEHIRYHFNEKPYTCEFCPRSFSQLQPYKAHVRKSHTKIRPYKCNFVDENNVKCEETFFDTKTYKFHLRDKHTNDQPFTCQFCSKKFNHSGTYQAHMRIHTGERPHQCVICGKSFAQISTHKAHMLTHSDEYKFPCTLCEKKFKQATNLKLHMRVHTRETPYKCEDCGRGFAQLVTYRNHRRIHTGEKPFECTYADCGKSFRHRNSFRRHLQTHTGEKPFECEICFKRLSQTSSYVKHMLRHEKPEKNTKLISSATI